MDGKETAVAPPIATLGIILLRADIDTDRFGTFAGDRPPECSLGLMWSLPNLKGRTASG